MVRTAFLAVAALIAVVLASCQPQTPGGTPTGCSATISGSVRDGTLVSGRDRATLQFPKGAVLRVTGSVTNVDSLFGAALPWQLSPAASGVTRAHNTEMVDQTWAYPGETGAIELTFSDSAGFTTDYDWELHLNATGSGCPPSTPEACAAAGGNVFYDDPTVVDGVQREGCFKDPNSCIGDILVEGSQASCGPDDILDKSLAAGDGYVAAIAGTAVLVVTDIAPEVGATVGSGPVIAGIIVVIIAGVAVYVIVTVDADDADTITEIPGVVEDVATRVDTLPDRNPGTRTSPDFELFAKIAMATCVKDLAVDQVIGAAEGLGLVPAQIDRFTGIVTFPNGEKRHLCELIPVYVPGGGTHASGVPTVDASLHIRDVLYGEHNRPDNYPGTEPNPGLPRLDWMVLTKAPHPDGTTDPNWRRKAPYSCAGSQSPTPATACDEWPWYASEQGGPGAHLRILDASHNSASGSDYQSFTSGTGCGLVDGSSFAVVPFPAPLITTGMRSFRIC